MSIPTVTTWAAFFPQTPGVPAHAGRRQPQAEAQALLPLRGLRAAPCLQGRQGKEQVLRPEMRSLLEPLLEHDTEGVYLRA